MVLLPNPTILRMARVARIIRLVRIVGWPKFFDTLHVMLKSIEASVSVLTWSLFLLVMLIMVIAMLVGALLQGFIAEESNDLAVRRLIFMRWGNFSRAFVTMFEITLANWGPPCWDLINNVDEMWGVFIIGYKMTFGFSVVQVIISVFVQQTFKVASRDEELMIKEKEAATAAFIRSLDRLFNEVDDSGDGHLSWDEFSAVLKNHRIRTWFAAMEVDPSELEFLFEMLDDGDGKIGKDEFISAMQKMKGGSKAMDIVALHHETKKLAKDVVWIKDTLGHRLVGGSSPSTARPWTPLRSIV
eukprot:CAMPEP_0204114932 /NCGR_PEP_ID=MMETSP0361-20130328/4549_1 /ASSEMBLY_ACC=CAM_ASM_000343 /TAXON_ID=268821 /ORGANISM="Scrippsiella Hangoei, Strain SHTV-5" /LENGTH=299 /DNA_ID=CAMNT_0051065541 /DNA_START=37 /DNA_END=936 /DNA_ORIENTATION=-